MRDDFNTQDYIVVTGQGGREYFLPKNRLASIKPFSDGENKAEIRIKAEDGSVSAGALKVRESAEDIADQVNGRLSAKAQQAIAEAIIIERQRQAEQKLATLPREQADKLKAFHDSFERSLGTIDDDGAVLKASITHVQGKIRGSRRLTLAGALLAAGNKSWLPDNVRKAADGAGRFLAGRDISLFHSAEQSTLGLVRLEHRRTEVARARDFDLEARQRTFDNERRYLENQLRDSSLRPEDHAILRERVDRYRRDHEPPDFKFIRDHRSGEFRNSKDLARERLEEEKRLELEREALRTERRARYPNIEDERMAHARAIAERMSRGRRRER